MENRIGLRKEMASSSNTAGVLQAQKARSSLGERHMLLPRLTLQSAYHYACELQQQEDRRVQRDWNAILHLYVGGCPNSCAARVADLSWPFVTTLSAFGQKLIRTGCKKKIYESFEGSL